jgi:hypothetical protein
VKLARFGLNRRDLSPDMGKKVSFSLRSLHRLQGPPDFYPTGTGSFLLESKAAGA